MTLIARVQQNEHYEIFDRTIEILPHTMLNFSDMPQIVTAWLRRSLRAPYIRSLCMLVQFRVFLAC
jgi:hypothetical protein